LQPSVAVPMVGFIFGSLHDLHLCAATEQVSAGTPILVVSVVLLLHVHLVTHLFCVDLNVCVAGHSHVCASPVPALSCIKGSTQDPHLLICAADKVALVQPVVAGNPPTAHAQLFTQVFRKVVPSARKSPAVVFGK